MYIYISPRYDIRMEGKRASPDIPRDRNVHVCANDDFNHVVLLKDIDDFLKATRKYHVSPHSLASRNLCKLFNMSLPIADFEKQYKFGKGDEKWPTNVRISKPDYFFTLTAHGALIVIAFCSAQETVL